MLDSICMNIPEWGNAKTDVAEIRSDIVCTLKNVETILNDLFAFHKQSESNAGLAVVLLPSPHPQNTSSLQQPIAELYRLCMNFSSSSSPRTAEVTESSCVSGEEDEEKFMHKRYSSAMGCCRLLVFCG